MSKKSELDQALKEAMRANDTVTRDTMRMALTAIKEAEILKKAELDDAEIMAILHKEMKSRHEALAEAEKMSRTDLIDGAKAEMKVLEAFLPAAMSDSDLEALVVAAIAEAGASAPSDMGKVMKVLLPKVQGRADGKRVSQLVQSKLQG
jgi:uncharacterized protein YqeY